MKIAESQISRLQGIAEQFRAEIFAYIKSKVSDPAIAEDLTQETFVKVGRALAKRATPEHFRGWLYQIARNTIIDFLVESRRFCRWKIRLSIGRLVIRKPLIPMTANSARTYFRTLLTSSIRFPLRIV